MKIDRQALTYYFIKAFQQYYWMGIWVFFYLRITDYKGIGLVEAIQIIVMFLSEIPTGFFADKFGRKISVTIGFTIVAIANILLAYSTSLTQLILFSSLTAFGVTFISGALDALMYDYYNNEEKYSKVISKGNAISSIAIGISVLLGGYLYTLDYRLPMLITGLVWGVAAIASMFLTEKSPKKDITPEVSFNIKQLFKEAKNIKIVVGLLIVASLIAVVYEGMADYQSIAYGFDAIRLSILMSLVFLSGAIGSYFTPKLRKKIKDLPLIILLIFIYALIWLLGPFLGMYIGGIFILIRAHVSGIYNNIQSIVLNRQLPSSKRATLLSIFSMLSNIPYVLSAYFIGIIVMSINALWLGFILGLIFLIIVIYLFFSWKEYIK